MKELSVKDSCQLESIRVKERVLTLRKEMSPDRREEGIISRPEEMHKVSCSLQLSFPLTVTPFENELGQTPQQTHLLHEDPFPACQSPVGTPI